MSEATLTQAHARADTIAQPGMLPPGTRVHFEDGETATVVESYGTEHLLSRRAENGGEREDKIDLAQHNVKINATTV